MSVGIDGNDIIDITPERVYDMFAKNMSDTNENMSSISKIYGIFDQYY
jgi:hypothetical protein